jgi:YHS domain-containing protein
MTAIASFALTVGLASCTKPFTTTSTSPQTGTAEASAPDSSTTAIEAAANQVKFFTKDGVAINGTDPVAYFQEGRPVQGSAEFSHQWMNATWHFSSAANRDLFAANPERYAPQYGGFCAWAVAEGYSAPTVPEAWRIVDGKLYLNFDTNIQRRWEGDIPGNIARADQNWPEVKQSLN